jgi:voltage-gated sodium channel type V alpha
MLCIICNTIILSLDRYPIGPLEDLIESDINIGFTAIFLIEMLIKLTGLGFKGYFREVFNIFDFIVVMLSLLDFGITIGIQSNTGGGALTALRGFRLLRVFKLAKHWP